MGDAKHRVSTLQIEHFEPFNNIQKHKMDKFKNKYRISSARLQNWDYGNNSSYFITICTKNKEHLFGEILNGEMQLNELGELVEKEWLRTLELRPDMELELGEFKVMPNHFHGIIIIGKNEYNSNFEFHKLSNATANKFGVQSKNLASIIRGFKSSVTTKFKTNFINKFELIQSSTIWQPRFHDHIIRDANSFERIQNYISNNPLNWKDDNFIDNN